MKTIVAMALSKQDFENKLDGMVGGAQGEFLKARLAEVMGWPKSTYIGKWDREAERLAKIEIPDFMTTQKTKSEFNRVKMLERIVGEWADSPLFKVASVIKKLEWIAQDKKLPKKIKTSDLKVEDWVQDFHNLVLSPYREE